MIFSWAKGNRTCRFCKMVIARGEQQIRIVIKPEKTKRGFWLHYFYHKECYLNYIAGYINDWFNKHPCTQRKLGRKAVPTYDRERRRSLMALYRYYKGRGNIPRMTELEREIMKLSYGHTPYKHEEGS